MFKPMLKPLAAVALLVVAGASHAAITSYTSQASFNSVSAGQGTDAFSNISQVVVTASPLNRTAGSYSYVASTLASPTLPTQGNPNSGVSFFGAGDTGNPALSVDEARNTIYFSTFSPTASALSGLFFNTDNSGLYTAGGLSLRVGDSTGATLDLNINPASMAGGFMGFTSTGTITYMMVTAIQPSAGFIFPTVDNFMLATAVPEVQTYAMMLAGLAAVGFVARRRQG